MTLRFIYTDSKGTLWVVNAAQKRDLERHPKIGKLTDEEYRKLVYDRSIPEDATDIHEMPADWLPPTDRTFRNAWKGNGSEIVVDMGKARSLWRDRMREARAPKLAKLDVEYQKADEAGDAQRKTQIAAQKQALRDVTADPSIEAAKTPEDLKAVWPVVLKS